MTTTKMTSIDATSIVELSNIGVTHVLRGIAGRKQLEALRHVDLAISPHELLVVVGESGSGKTTLGRVIAGLQRPTNGTIRFMGKEIRKRDGEDFTLYRRAVQMVHQDPYTSLNPALTIEQSLTPGIRRWNEGMSREDARRRAAECLSLVGLSGAAQLQKYPHQLSGGQRQRIAIARAISINPDLIVLDEPVSMVDASLRIDILDMLIELKRKIGTSYIFITHDVALAKYFCEKANGGRMVVLYRGLVMEMGETTDVVSSPANPYMMALIASSPGSGFGGSDSWSSKLANSQEDEVPGCKFFPRCIYAQEVCRSSEPPLHTVDPDHVSACHFAENLARSTPSTAAERGPPVPG
jgi:oligopeptide/dipeptide ABC transporter ATP-binding protein